MIRNAIGLLVLLLCVVDASHAAAEAAKGGEDSKLVVDDNFDRSDLGATWSTNDARALRTSGVSQSQFQSQAQIHDGTLQIRRTQGSDHGASVKTPVEFTDAVIELRFHLTGKNTFGVNLNDPECKTVHAGHLCRVEIGPKHVLIQDQKTGNMDNDYRKLRDSGAPPAQLAKRIEGKSKRHVTETVPDQWHDLRITLRGDAIQVAIDASEVGEFRSDGIAHPTKRNLAFAVNRAVDIDDLKIRSLAAKP